MIIASMSTFHRVFRNYRTHGETLRIRRGGSTEEASEALPVSRRDDITGMLMVMSGMGVVTEWCLTRMTSASRRTSKQKRTQHDLEVEVLGLRNIRGAENTGQEIRTITVLETVEGGSIIVTGILVGTETAVERETHIAAEIGFANTIGTVWTRHSVKLTNEVFVAQI